MDRDRTTRTGARAPGVERPRAASMAVFHRVICPALNGKTGWPRRARKMEANHFGVKGMPGAGLTRTPGGKAPSDRPALEPYWGKPAVRNLRGDDGNVGIIEFRSAPSSYPTALLAPCSRAGCAHFGSVRLPPRAAGSGGGGPGGLLSPGPAG